MNVVIFSLVVSLVIVFSLVVGLFLFARYVINKEMKRYLEIRRRKRVYNIELPEYQSFKI